MRCVKEKVINLLSAKLSQIRMVVNDSHCYLPYNFPR
jgi:hypothetical protein